MRTARRRQYIQNSLSIARNIAIRGQYDFEYDLMPCHCNGMSISKRSNLLKAGGNLLYRKLQPWSMPIHMQIELTNYCNLRCPVCPTGAGTHHRRPQAIDPALFERLMAEAGKYLLTASLFGWG